MVENRWKSGGNPVENPVGTWGKARFILWETAVLHGISTTDLQSSTRTRNISTARAAAARRLLLETDLSGSEIAKLIGRRSAVRMRDYIKPNPPG